MSTRSNQSDQSDHSRPRDRSAARACAAAVLLLGCATLLGWALGVPALKSVLPGAVTMKPNTALALLLSGAALWLLAGPASRSPSPAGARAGRGCALLAGLLGLATLGEYLLGARLGIDELLARDDPGAVATNSPGRMAPASALCFVLFGAALLLLGPRAGETGDRGGAPAGGAGAAQLLAVAAGLVALHALIGYLFGVSEFAGLPAYTRMAVHTTAGFLLLAVGVLWARPDRGPMAVVTAGTPGGAAARLLLLAAVLVPPLIGGLRLVGERAGLYGTAYGVSLSTVAGVAVSLLIVWLSASRLQESDRGRTEAEEGLREANAALEASVAERTRELEAQAGETAAQARARGEVEERLRAVVSSTPVILFALDADGVFTLSEGRGLEALGLRPGAVVGRSAFDLYRDDPGLAAHLRRALAGEQVSWLSEFGGRMFEAHYAPVRAGDGGPTVGLLGAAYDVTDRERARREAEERAELLRLLQDAVLVRRLDGTILSVNPAAEQLYGWSEAEALGRVTHELLVTRFPDGIAEQERSLLDTGRWEGELVHTRKDGGTIVVASRQALRRGGPDGDGAAGLVLEANRDVTEERRAQEAERGSVAALRGSQARLAAVIDSAMDAIITADESQTVVAFNPAAERVFGYDAAEIIGRPLTQLLPERFRGGHAGHVSGFGGAAGTDRTMGVLDVLSARRKDGTEFPIEATISRVEVGGQTLFTAILRDVTARVEAERRQRFLLELGERVRPLTDPDEVMDTTVRAVGGFLGGTYCVFSEVDLDAGTVTLCGQYAAAGHPPRPMGDVQPLRLITTPEQVARLERGEMVVIADTATDPLTAGVYGERLSSLGVRAVVIAPCLSGGRWVASLSVEAGVPRGWAPEEVVLLEGIAERTWRQVENARLFQEARRELAERRRAEAELRELAETLEERVQERTAALSEANASLESFNHVVAHDLRAPLRGVQGFAIALQEDYGAGLDEEAQDYIGRIVDSAERMGQLISDLLEYSRLSRVELPLAVVPLTAAVRDALRVLGGEAGAAAAMVDVREPLPAVIAHRGTLVQVVTNLLGNALKFSKPGVPPRVWVRAEGPDRRRRVRLWVEDEGIGIAPEHQGRIFEVFTRLHGQETFPGTGVGLAIVRKGAERMGGAAGVESAPGVGSRFWVELSSAEGGER